MISEAVPLLLIDILLVMKWDPDTYVSKARTLGVGSALTIASGYHWELCITGDLSPRSSRADWLLTVPLLLIEILLVMELGPDTYASKAKSLGGQWLPRGALYHLRLVPAQVGKGKKASGGGRAPKSRIGGSWPTASARPRHAMVGLTL